MSHEIICGLSDEAAARDELPPPERLLESFDRMLALARAMAAADVKPFGIDARLAFWNAREAFKIIAPYLDEIRELRRVDAAAIERIPDLAMALLHAVRAINLLDPPKSDVAERLARARRLRYVMLHQAQAAAGLGLLPEAVVERIRKGTGPMDNVEDLLALVTLFQQHRAVLTNKIVVTEDLLVEGEQLGLALQNALRPVDAPRSGKEKAQELAQAIDDRNRIATLLVEAYAELQRAAAYLGVRVRALQARRVVKKKVEKGEG